MLINLNGTDMEMDVSGLGEGELGALLEDIKSKKFKDKEFIVEIILDGTEVPSEDFDDIVNKPLSEISTLEIKTKHPRDVSLSTLKNLGPFLEALVSSLEQSADKFRMEKAEEANSFFVSCVEGLQMFVGLLDKIKTLNAMDFTGITFESEPISIKENNLLKISNSLYDAQKNKDWVSMGDVLEYELVPLLRDWLAILPVLSDAIGKKES